MRSGQARRDANRSYAGGNVKKTMYETKQIVAPNVRTAGLRPAARPISGRRHEPRILPQADRCGTQSCGPFQSTKHRPYHRFASPDFIGSARSACRIAALASEAMIEPP